MQDETLARFTELVGKLGGQVIEPTVSDQEYLYNLSWQHDEMLAGGFIDNGDELD
jgi:hypothetical protein